MLYVQTMSGEKNTCSMLTKVLTETLLIKVEFFPFSASKQDDSENGMSMTMVGNFFVGSDKQKLRQTL